MPKTYQNKQEIKDGRSPVDGESSSRQEATCNIKLYFQAME